MCELSGIQIWLLDGSNVSYSYFIRESGKLRVSTLAWEEPVLEADQDTHLQTLLQSVCVGGEWKKEWCLCVCACMYVCTKPSVCIGAETRKVKSASKRRSLAETEKVCAVQIWKLIFVENLCFAAFHVVCVRARACRCLSKILKPKLSSKILPLKCYFFICCCCLILVK